MEQGAHGDDGTTDPHPLQLLRCQLLSRTLHSSPSLTTFISKLHSELQNTCIYRLEAYWSYELCIGKHMRQYHEEKYVDKGKKRTKLTEYFLGRVSCCVVKRPFSSTKLYCTVHANNSFDLVKRTAQYAC